MAEQNKTPQRGDEQPNDGSNRSHGEGTPLYLTSDSTLQSPEEHTHDKNVNPRRNTSMDVSDSDLTDAKAGTLTGREATEDNND